MPIACKTGIAVHIENTHIGIKIPAPVEFSKYFFFCFRVSELRIYKY